MSLTDGGAPSDNEIEETEDSNPSQNVKSVESGLKDICIFFLRGKCAFDKRCHKYHKNMPYQWQFIDMNAPEDQEWNDLNAEQNVDLEMNYSDANKSEVYLKLG